MKTLFRTALFFAALLCLAAPARAQVTCANPATLASQPCLSMGLATPVASTAAENGKVLKASAGAIVHLAVAIGATSGYLALIDATAVPSNGAITPKWCQPVPSNGTLGGGSWSWGQTPLYFTTGITALFGTASCVSFTGSTTAVISAGVL